MNKFLEKSWAVLVIITFLPVYCTGYLVGYTVATLWSALRSGWLSGV